MNAGSPSKHARDCIVRLASTADAEALGQLIREPAVALNLPVPTASERARAQAGAQLALRELLKVDSTTLVAESREGIVGYAQLRCGTRPPAQGWMRGSMELRRHAMQARHRGVGTGIRLLEAALESAHMQDASGVWLKVAKEATTAADFYARHGFHVVGTSIAMDGAQRRELWVMHRRFNRGRTLAVTPSHLQGAQLLR